MRCVVLRNSSDKGCSSLPGGQLLAKECVEYRARGVTGLQLVLDVQSGEDIVGVADRQVRGVGVVGGLRSKSAGNKSAYR